MEFLNIKSQIMKDFNKRAVDLNNTFHEVHQSFFTYYQQDIQNLKKTLILDQPVPKLPTDIWVAINDHLDHLRKQIRTLEEKNNPFLNQPFWRDWKEESTAGLKNVPGKISTSFVLEKFDFNENDNFRQKQIKKISLRYYSMTDKLFSIIKRNNSYLDSGRKINFHNFLQYYFLLPIAQFLFEQWNDCLKITAQTLESLSKITEQLKDELVAVEKLAERDIYWKKVVSPELEKIISNYEISIRDIGESNNYFYHSLSAEIQAVLDDLSENSEQIWQKAGTVLLPNRKFNHRKINSQWRLISKRYQRLRESWEINLKKLQGEWQKDIDLAQVQLSAACYWYETGQIIKNKFYKDIIPLFMEIKKKINETKDSIQINVKDVEDKSEIKNKLLLLNRKLVRAIRDKDLPDLLSLLNPELFSQSFSGFIKRMYSDLGTLPDEHTVLAYVDLQNIPLKIKSDKVALKDLLQGETIYTAEAKIEDINMNLRLELDAASRHLSRMDQVIEYNLEGALNLIRDEDNEQSWQEAIDITHQGLERVEQNIEDLMTSLRSQIDDSLKKFDLIAADLEEDIQILGDNEELLKLKIRLTRARTKARLIELRKKVWQYIRLLLPKLLQLLQSTIKKIHGRYSKVQRLAGLAVSDIQSERSFTHHLTDVEKKVSQMPYIYQRIFRTEPLEDNKFFVGRSEVLDMLSQDFEDFKKEYHPIAAITGEKGSGKTSTLYYAKRNILNGFPLAVIDIPHTIYTSIGLIEIIKPALNLPAVNSADDVIRALNSQKEKRICIIENVHNLFLRTMEGFQALDDLLLIISKTKQNVFWIISCGRYAWEYLETVKKISSFFNRVIHLEDLSTEEMTTMILDRHQISGYGIYFNPPAKIEQSRQYKKLRTPLLQQQYLQEYFFKRLSETAEGNIRVAIYFWLSAIDEFQESSINMSLDIKAESQFLHQLPSDEILSLAAFIQHEYLNEEQHALIFNQSFADSCILIEKLFKKGLLIRNENDFLVHPYLYRPIVKTLKSRNII